MSYIPICGASTTLAVFFVVVDRFLHTSTAMALTKDTHAHTRALMQRVNTTMS